MSFEQLKMRTLMPTPVFNTPYLSKVFSYPLSLDGQKLLRAVEVVLFPGTLVEVVGFGEKDVVQVRTDEYPGDRLYMHKQFLKVAKDDRPREKQCPSLGVLLDKFKNWPKTMYIWGGNFHRGVPELAKLYPIPKGVDAFTKMVWTLRGVDCTGLLYEATEGCLPRNSGQLMNFGVTVSILDKTDEQIAKVVIPGDLIVWRGHVLFIEQGTVIESRLPEGVIRTDLLQRLGEIRKILGYNPVDDPAKHPDKRCYVVRRWHPEGLGQF